MTKCCIDQNKDIFMKKITLLKNSKELDGVYKKLNEIKTIFTQLKILAVLEAPRKDGIVLPKEIDHKNYLRYNIPDGLIDLADKGQKGFLALKIVEIIGEDEINNLDPETIYFITNLLNKLNLKQFRNEILGTALPLRI